jgi:hypothetical protein
MSWSTIASDALRRDDPAHSRWPDVRRQRVDAPLFAVERERVVTAAILAPVRLRRTRAELVGLASSRSRELALAPDLARELGDARFAS